MNNNYMTTEYIANAFVNYTKLNLTFMGIANNDYEGMFENNKAFTPGDNISAVIPSYPRVMTGLDLTEYGNQGYTTQVYNITLEQDGLCNVLRSMDNYTEAFKIDKSKTWEQFILPTHKAISKSIEYYIINKLNQATSHCPISSVDYKLMVKNWITRSVSNNTPNNPTFVNYILSHKAYTEKMNYLHVPTIVVSPNAANYFRQSALSLYTPALAEKIAVDAYLGNYGGFEVIQSPELVGNGMVQGTKRLEVKGPTTSLPIDGQDTAAVSINNAITVTQLVFSRTNSFNLGWIKVVTAAGKKPVMWDRGESMCLYFGKTKGNLLPLGSSIGVTNQISQLSVTSHVPLMFLEEAEPIPVGDATKATEWWIQIMPLGNTYIIGNNAPTWRGKYLGPALSTKITDPNRRELDKLMLDANAVGYNFEFGRIGAFDTSTIAISEEDASLPGARPINKGDLVTKAGMGGLLDNYQYESNGQSVASEWAYGVTEQGLTVINPPIGKVASADTTIAKDKDTGKYSFRATYQGNNIQSNNYYRIDTLVGVGVVPIYTYAFPMPVGISL